jgi:hypothetical protein
LALTTFNRRCNLQHHPSPINHPRYLTTQTLPTEIIFLTLLLLAAPDSTSAPHYMHLCRKEKPVTTMGVCLSVCRLGPVRDSKRLITLTLPLQLKDFRDMASFVGFLRLESHISSLTKQLLERKETQRLCRQRALGPICV